MSIVTLTTDFGWKDHYVGAVKGALLRELPDLNIVDISHGIDPFNILQGAYILKYAYREFPVGTVHIIGIDSEWSKTKPHLAIEANGHFFIGADTGIFNLLFTENEVAEIVEISLSREPKTRSFPTRDVFAPAACRLLRTNNLSEIGGAAEAYRKSSSWKPVVEGNGKRILGMVIYVDRYDNVVSNISRKDFEEVGQGRAFEISLPRNTSIRIRNIHEQYTPEHITDISSHQGKEGALFNSADFLEIAIYRSDPRLTRGAAGLLGLKYEDPIVIEFQ